MNNEQLALVLALLRDKIETATDEIVEAALGGEIDVTETKSWVWTGEGHEPYLDLIDKHRSPDYKQEVTKTERPYAWVLQEGMLEDISRMISGLSPNA